MIRNLLHALGILHPLVPCWCGKLHRQGFWHDPTHGAIDRDIQDHARDLMDLPPNASALTPGLLAMEQTMQRRRNEGRLLYWERGDGA